MPAIVAGYRGVIMKLSPTCLAVTAAGLVLTATPSATQAPSDTAARKKQAMALVDTQRADLVALSERVWEYAETALREDRSARLLADHAEKHGFTVERGVAGMPSAFVATYGQGRPVIAIMGEYDALPGISQKASAVKEPFEEGAAGHGCGHNLFGPASLGAAVAVKELIAAGAVKGTIRFLGTPAEESIGGKIYMIREGVFKDVDVALVWHPGDETKVDHEGSQANVQFFVDFRGRTAHAAADPWNGRSAADAIEAFTHGLNLLREHVRPTVRIHYTVQKAGDVPNVVPDYARILTWLRDSRRAGVDEVFARVKEIARGAALVAGVEETVTIQTGYTETNILTSGLELLHRNLTFVGEPAYTAEEEAFARALQKATGKEERGMVAALQPLEPIAADPPGGSTDVGDVSWVVPTLHFSVATAPKGVPWHAWPVVASSRTSIGHKGMIRAAQALAVTAVDLYASTAARDAIRKEWAEKTKGVTYRWLVPDGPPPVPRRD
jgi:aminobenzoyl-glutamate utilization protein B